jgi:hypothetical protein
LCATAIGVKFRRDRGWTCNSRFVICNRGGSGDAQNIFNRQQWLGPTLNPTSTQFGRVTTVV